MRSLMAVFFVYLCAFAPKSYADEKLVVFAASSLTDVMAELGDTFDQKHQTQTVFSLASTSVLARQIKDGAPAHLFISANSAWMDDVVAAGAVMPESIRVVAGNRLILVAAKDDTFPLPTEETLTADYPLATAAQGQPFAIGSPDHVPAGMYAREALQTFGLWDGIKNRLIPMPNVRAVMANVDRGEVAGGIVYASDMRFSINARIVGLFPETSHAPIRYRAGVVNQPEDEKTQIDKAKAFLSFLLTPEASKIFMKYGFLPPPA